MSLPHPKKILLSSTLILLFSTASFADWQMNPVIKVGVETDDNANLSTRTDAELELSGYLLDAGVEQHRQPILVDGARAGENVFFAKRIGGCNRHG